MKGERGEEWCPSRAGSRHIGMCEYEEQRVFKGQKEGL